jgi:hypothetical protein
VHFLDECPGDRHAVAAGNFGQGNGDRRSAIHFGLIFASLLVISHQTVGIAGAEPDLRHLKQIHRFSFIHPDHQIADFCRRAQKLSGDNAHLHVLHIGPPGFRLGIGSLNRLRDLLRGDAISGQAARMNIDGQCFLRTVDNKTLPGLGNLLEMLQRGAGNFVEGGGTDLPGPERKGHEGDAVDALGTDQRMGGSRRNPVHVGGEFVVDLHQGGTHPSAHLKAHGDHGFATIRHRIHVAHPGSSLIIRSRGSLTMRDTSAGECPG